MTRRTRAERLAMPLARDVAKDLAVEHGACIRPVHPDHMEHARRLLHVVAGRQHWQAALAEARRRAGIEPPSDLSATGRAT